MFKWVSAVLFSICLVVQSNAATESAEWIEVDGNLIDKNSITPIIDGYTVYVASPYGISSRLFSPFSVNVKGATMTITQYETNCKTNIMGVLRTAIVDDQWNEIATIVFGEKYKYHVLEEVTPHGIQVICERLEFLHKHK